MKTRNTDTALLIFARSTKAEGAHKRWAHDDKSANQNFAGLLNQKTLQLAKKSNLNFFIIDESQQQGTTFGERIANSTYEVFQKGYKQVIAIGNDCPELKAADLTEAAANLDQGTATLGPDKRGGAYLIGLSRNQFDMRKFSDLAWQSSDTLDSLKNYFGECQILDVKQDLNEFGDVISVLKATLSKGLKTAIRLSTGLYHSIEVVYLPFFESESQVSFLPLRAPPIHTYR